MDSGFRTTITDKGLERVDEEIFVPSSVNVTIGAIELSGERRVSFKDKGQAFTMAFRRITDTDWRKYFNGMALESERIGTQRVDRFDFTSAGIALVNECLVQVKGYRSRTGDFMAQANWRDAIPYGHKAMAVGLLTSVTSSTADVELFFEPDVQEVVLDAKWGSDDPGKMTQYSGLVHRFQQVTLEHQRRYNRATSEARVVGGSRSGRTIYPGRHGMLADMYDELIVEVNGYAFKGGMDTAAIKAEMDTFHKVAAVTELFAVPESSE